MPRPAQYGFVRTSLSLGPIAVASGTSAQTILLSWTVPSRRVLERIDVIPTVAGTGAGAARTLNVRRGNASGTVVGTAALALADLGTIGTPKTYAALTTGANFEDTDTLSIQIDSGGTQFTALTAIFVLHFRELAQRAY